MSAKPTERHARIMADLSEAIAPLGVLVEDLTVTPAGKRRLVRVLVDRDLADVDQADETSKVDALDLDTVGDITRVISERLDDTDAMGEAPYVLEVSSPGVDRPLTQLRHFRRNVGRSVTVSRAEEPDVTGRIVRVGQHDLDLDTGTDEPLTLPLEGITKAKVNVEFNRSDAKEN